MWFLFSSQQSLPISLCPESFCPSAQKPILRTQSPSDPHYSVFKSNLVLFSLSRFPFNNYVITFVVFSLLAHILRIWNPLFSHPNIDHSSTHDLWAEVVSIVPTNPAVSTVKCGFYWRVRRRSVSHAGPDLTHPSATSSLTPSTALSCGLKLRQCCNPTDDFGSEGGPRGIWSDTDCNLVHWNYAALSNKIMLL